MRIALACLIAVLNGPACAQETPEDIARRELPKAARCVVCEATGASHGEETPAAGVRYKGKSFYFCSAKEVATFKKDPEAYMPPVLPRPAPSLALKNLSGELVKGYGGKVSLVDFWATWCGPCVATMPDLQKLHDKLSQKGLVVLGMAIDEEGEKKVAPFVAKRRFTYPILLDNVKLWKAFGVRNIPALFLVDKNGQIVKQWIGKPDKKEVEQAVTALLE